MSVKIESGDKAIVGHDWSSIVLVAVDRNPYDLVDRAVPLAALYSGGGRTLAEKKFRSRWTTLDGVAGMHFIPLFLQKESSLV